MHAEALLGEKGTETYSVSPNDTVLTVLQLFNDQRIGFAVVVDAAGHVAGGISERDICRSIALEDSAGRLAKVKDVMDENVLMCELTDNLVTVMARMTEARKRHMLVVDQSGLKGVISIGDVVKNRLDEVLEGEKDLLENILGSGYSE